MKLAHDISEMRPVPKTARIRHLLVHSLSVKYDSVPPGVVPFVVIATERSGSSLLMDILSTRWATIRSDGEISNPQVRRGRSIEELLATTYFSDSGHRCIGSKIIRRQLSDDDSSTDLVMGMPFVNTTYEELMENRDLEMEKIGEFLGVGKPDRSMAPRLRHQNPEPLSQLISNFDQLRSDLSDLRRADLVSQLDG